MDTVNDKFLEIGGRGTLTTLQTPGYEEGDGAITLVSPTSWPDGHAVAFSMRRIEIGGENDGKEIQGSYTEWIGILNGSTIDNLTLISGVDQPYAPGTQTQVMIHVSSTWGNRLIQGLLVSHSRDGKLLTAAVKEALGNDGLLTTYVDELIADCIANDAVWTATSGFNAGMTSGIGYMNGQRFAINPIGSKSFTASKDTYVYTSNAGVISYLEVANNAAAPTTPANSILKEIIVTNGSTITKIQPCNRSLNSAYKVVLQDSSAAVGSSTYKTFTLTGLEIGATYLVGHQTPTLGNASSGNGTVITNITLDAVLIANVQTVSTTSAFQNPRHNMSAMFTATATSHTLAFQAAGNGLTIGFSDLLQNTYVLRVVGKTGF